MDQAIKVKMDYQENVLALAVLILVGVLTRINIVLQDCTATIDVEQD